MDGLAAHASLHHLSTYYNKYGIIYWSQSILSCFDMDYK